MGTKPLKSLMNDSNVSNSMLHCIYLYFLSSTTHFNFILIQHSMFIYLSAGIFRSPFSFCLAHKWPTNLWVKVYHYIIKRKSMFSLVSDLKLFNFSQFLQLLLASSPHTQPEIKIPPLSYKMLTGASRFISI